jgi:hypothetical protein
MTTATKATATATKDGLPSMIAYLTRVLKTPTIGAFWEDLAAQARDENWSHEEYLAALLQRQVADRVTSSSTTGSPLSASGCCSVYSARIHAGTSPAGPYACSKADQSTASSSSGGLMTPKPTRAP